MLSEILTGILFRTQKGSQNDPLRGPNGTPLGKIPTGVLFRTCWKLTHLIMALTLQPYASPGSRGPAAARAARATPAHPLDTFGGLRTNYNSLSLG